MKKTLLAILAVVIAAPVFSSAQAPGRAPLFPPHHQGSDASKSVTVPQGQTTDLTPLTLGGGPGPPEDSVCRLPFFVFASDHNGDVAQWYWLVATRRVGSGTTTILTGTPDVKKSAGAATWTATLAFADDRINATVTGALGVTVDWLQTSDDLFCMAGPFIP